MTLTTAPTIDLPALIERLGVRLHRYGRSYRCACPLHAGDNELAFSIYQSRSGQWRWHCFSGDCGDGDAIAFVRRYYGVGYREACQMLGVTPASAPSGPRSPQPPPVEPPSAQWQHTVGRLVDQAVQALWSPAGQAARAYLYQRGLTDALIRRAGLGYHPAATRIRAETLGLDGDNPYYPAGIVIPYWVEGDLWRVQVRRLSNTEPRYLSLAGSSGAPPYLIAPITSAKPLVLAEGPVDVLAIMQAAGDLVTAIGTGATGCRAVRWIARCAVAPLVLAAHDADEAGDAAAAYWCDALQPRCTRWRPTLHDPAEMLQLGGLALVRQWIEQGLASAEGDGYNRR
ncbi:MAG TPA: hypothetical protein DEF43_08355 [Chloroflexus aurantiacus]|uniref:Zinc finger CHC2-family protein n=1 Tax=Chloroflexus aurantiacus (strain ATCC 29366 / DSM 635 / J-10-fl) TaxID=324602 RepID=A9WCW6_CHLAA|nr:CHC2 zinc finger domain-containing protein [Chloroflexus aurantiacus]ABY33535.1 zinc finger CHC2-family protein [Chloroflexus aurantiacus J-10-fl]HBW67158.1 hypothetical protein [Chloroflexus aurantiacus]